MCRGVDTHVLQRRPSCVVWWEHVDPVGCSIVISSSRVLPRPRPVLHRTCAAEVSLDRCPRPTPSEMFLYRCHVLAVLTGGFLARCVHIRACTQSTCGQDHICCFQENNSTGLLACCTDFDKTYHNIAMITRKLSGVLIMLLLFAVGYFVQRMLCSRSRQSAPSHSGQPAVTASQELLVETCTPSGFMTPIPAVKLPSYDACKRLPTYEETMRDLGGRGRAEAPMDRAT